MPKTFSIGKGVYGALDLDPETSKWYVNLFDAEGKDIAQTPLFDTNYEAVAVAKVLAREYRKGVI